MTRVKVLICLYVLFFPVCITAQDITNFTQFFINPYTFNPSYAGIEGRSALFIAYRKQWATIDGGPTVANLSYHTPVVGGLNFGLNISNDTRGIVNTSGMLLSFGYTVTIDHEKFIRFGLSAGAAWNGINVDELPDGNDPVLNNLLDKNFSLQGNAGLSFHLKSFHFGASLPNIFSPALASPDAFTITEVKPFQSIIAHMSNRFYFAGDKHIFEPYILYRVHIGPREDEALPSQFEVAGVLHLNHIVWVGGSYKQDFGISALAGIKNKFFLIGGSYSLKNSGVNELNSPTYEIQLSYLVGSKKKDKPVYSFVNSEKEKIRKPPVKTPAQLAAEKRKQEEELAKKKAEEEKAALEAQLVAEQQAQQKAEQERLEREAQQQAQQVRTPVETERGVSPYINIPYVKSAFGVHDGGPRFTNRTLLPVMEDGQSEVVQISQVEAQAGNPTEVHGTDPNTNPNAQRHEIVQRGAHPQELEVGHYVINGVFSTAANADRFVKALAKLGFNANYGHLSKKDLWYVYVTQTSDINQAKLDREKYRNLRVFKDAWLLTVEN
jgi:type IX secretion system PorP/SprF family membrane protein